jgi:hypothetical protein
LNISAGSLAKPSGERVMEKGEPEYVEMTPEEWNERMSRMNTRRESRTLLLLGFGLLVGAVYGVWIWVG